MQSIFRRHKSKDANHIYILVVPSSWSDLSQAQLKYVLKTISRLTEATNNLLFLNQDDYSLYLKKQIQTVCFLHFAKLEVVGRYGDDSFILKGKRKFIVSDDEFASMLTALDWLSEVPTEPIRLERIGGRRSIAAPDIRGLSFELWLTVENLWTGYACTSDEKLLDQMAEFLYPNVRPHKLKGFERLAVFYWWSSLKQMLNEYFPNFFVPDESASKGTPNYIEMQRNSETIIRALTKGDVTKYSEIMHSDVWHALYELDAIAKEYKEIEAMKK